MVRGADLLFIDPVMINLSAERDVRSDVRLSLSYLVSFSSPLSPSLAFFSVSKSVTPVPMSIEIMRSEGQM